MKKMILYFYELSIPISIFYIQHSPTELLFHRIKNSSITVVVCELCFGSWEFLIIRKIKLSVNEFVCWFYRTGVSDQIIEKELVKIVKQAFIWENFDNEFFFVSFCERVKLNSLTFVKSYFSLLSFPKFQIPIVNFLFKLVYTLINHSLSLEQFPIPLNLPYLFHHNFRIAHCPLDSFVCRKFLVGLAHTIACLAQLPLWLNLAVLYGLKGIGFVLAFGLWVVGFGRKCGWTMLWLGVLCLVGLQWWIE